MTQTTRLPTAFISHGGGPWPWMEDQTGGMYTALRDSLAAMPAALPSRPKALLMVSAHWETPEFALMTHPHPPMLYDYGGFPEHTYRIQYPAPSDAALIARVQALLSQAGVPVGTDAQRGFDHGMFAPMAVMYPQADMPTVQLSLKRGLDPQTHLALGRVLAPLRDEGYYIVGSGLSYHNLRAFGPAGRTASAQFDAWLDETMRLPGPQRSAALLHWAQAPAARAAHPREEHLLPLMVAVGAAENDAATRIYYETEFGGGITVSSYRLG